MKATLIIDTSHIQKIEVTLRLNDVIYTKTIETAVRSSQILLPTIEEMLHEHSLTFQNITDIEISTGPGSFTGLRVGATVGTILSFLLDIPINESKPGTLPELHYGKDKWNISS